MGFGQENMQKLKNKCSLYNRAATRHSVANGGFAPYSRARIRMVP